MKSDGDGMHGGGRETVSENRSALWNGGEESGRTEEKESGWVFEERRGSRGHFGEPRVSAGDSNLSTVSFLSNLSGKR